MNKRVKKIWGWTHKVFEGNNIEVHRIEVVPGGFCSVHRHEHKHNMFFVERGALVVRQLSGPDGDSETRSTHLLGAGDTLSIRPHVIHQFEAQEPTVAYEIYWVELGEDIERFKVGGVHSHA